LSFERLELGPGYAVTVSAPVTRADNEVDLRVLLQVPPNDEERHRPK